MAAANSLETLPWPPLQRLCSMLPCASLFVLAEASQTLETVLEEAGFWRDRLVTRLRRIGEKIDRKVEECQVKEKNFYEFHTSGPYARFLASYVTRLKFIQQAMEMPASIPAIRQLKQLLTREGQVDMEEEEALAKYEEEVPSQG